MWEQHVMTPSRRVNKHLQSTHRAFWLDGVLVVRAPTSAPLCVASTLSRHASFSGLLLARYRCFFLLMGTPSPYTF